MVQKKWGLWGDGVRLVVLSSPYRLLVEPIVGVHQGGRRAAASRTR